MILHKNSNPKLLTRDQVGGKAFNLLVLSDLGLPVPTWLVLPVSALGLIERENFDLVLDELLEQVIGFFESETPTARHFAVRSSAVGEDGAELSFAGLFHSELNVSQKGLKPAIQKVVNSARSDRVMAYLEEHGMSSGVKMAVVVQVMIPAEVLRSRFRIGPGEW